jgi:uncharacterized membrane-anchored protein YitT (DUF2179 family)
MNLRSLSNWWDAFLVVMGSIIGAIAVIVFLVPSQIAPGGVSGIAVILNSLFGVPLGIVIILGNIPIQYLGYRMLGGSKVLFMTVLSLLIYAIALDMLAPMFHTEGVSNDGLLNAIFGGVLGGVSSGMVLRGGGTPGGTATLARILQYRYGLPMASAYMYTDTGTILLAGLAFGWEAVLLAILSMFVSGLATDYFLEGPSVIRTVTIITDYPEEVSQTLLHTLRRGVTAWQGMGMYTHETRHVLFITVHRAQVNELQEMVHAIDPQAFVVIGQGHVAYGHGFKTVHPPPKEAT